MASFRFIIRCNQLDPRSDAYLSNARALGFHNLKRIECQDLYFIEGQLSQEALQQLALKLLIDPVTQSATWAEMDAASTSIETDWLVVDVALHPGVTDPVAHEVFRAAHEIGINGLQRVATGLRFQLEGLSVDEAGKLARGLLANPVIQRWAVGQIEPSFPQEVASSGKVTIIPVRTLDGDGLLALSKDRRAALDLAEMKAIRDYFRKENRDPSDVEFETIAQTWSEHCVHKTFKARIDVHEDGKIYQVDSLIKTHLKSATDEINAPWVLSAFVDNAGVIDLDGENEVSFKVETHNHPSAIEPFGGANTGVGGVIRDVLGVSHKPIANTDVLCFGPQDSAFDQFPANILHPRRVMSGVVAGVQDYGNKIGIPTVNGAILFDGGYTANPLVFCGCVGTAPKGLHMRAPQNEDRIILLGGRTGRDGLRGATFSSMTMDAQTGEVAGASVQIGDPITEKGLIDVIVRARDLKLYHAITDCGAGGLSSAIGEMSSTIGADVELQNVRLKYAGLAPWEIWLSEAQERMVLAVPSQNVAQLQELCDTFDTELTDVGKFTGDHCLIVRYAGKVVLELDNDFLHDGIPQRRLNAVIENRDSENKIRRQSDPMAVFQFPKINYAETLLKLLSHPNIASKSSVIRIYDHEIQGGTVVKPLTGVCSDAPSDASVIHPLGAKGMAGLAIANGINPEYGKRDPYRMAMAVVDEAIRNAVAVGANPERIALLDNFCWGDPHQPETLGALVEAARGSRDAALLFRTPFISGKDSLNNEYIDTDGQRRAIPPTLLISSIGIMQDVTQAVTMDLKEAGSELFLAGKFMPTFGGSHFSMITSQFAEEPVPATYEVTLQVYQALYGAVCSKLIRACHDLSEGGLAVALAEMCIGGRLGATLEFTDADLVPHTFFGETTGCLIVEVSKKNKAEFLARFKGLPLMWIGRVTSEPRFRAGVHGFNMFDISVDELLAAWNMPLQ